MKNDTELIKSMNQIATKLGYEVSGVNPTKLVLVWNNNTEIAEISAGRILTVDNEFTEDEVKVFEKIRDLQAK